MAEFDTSGFKAVDKFFNTGGNDDHHHDDDGVKGNKSSVTSIQGKRRGGVGAIKQSSSQANTNLTNQVLKVGKKRIRNNQGNVDDDDEEEGDNDSIEDDDGLNIGRTAIAKDSSEKKSDSYQQSTSSESKNKRKPGKKERQSQQQPSKNIRNNNKNKTSSRHDLKVTPIKQRIML